MTDGIMKWFYIGLVYLVTALPYTLPYGYGYGDSKEEENSRKISTLEKQVKVLTNELKNLKEDVKVLKVDSITEADPDLLPLGVSRTMGPNGRVRFTLKYMAKPALLGQLHLSWVDADRHEPIQESISNEVPNLPPGVYESNVETDASNTSRVSVTVGASDYWYRLDIKNSLEGNVIQRITSFPEGQVTPKGDIVYEPGTNASMEFTCPLEERTPGGRINMNFKFYINSPGSDDILESSGENKLKNFLHAEKKIYFDKREFHIVFNTSVIAYSGLVMAMVGETYRTDPVYRIEKYYLLALRPSNQSGAFREGFLAARGQSGLEINVDGNWMERCRSGQLCRVDCLYFGNNPNQVVMLRTVNGIVETIIPKIHVESRFYSSAMDTFYMTSDQNPINYTCVASNAGGQRIVETYIFYFDDPPTFVENQTTIEVSPEGGLNVTCTATGSPLPQMNIRFVLSNNMEFEVSESDLEVLYQTNDTISVSKVLNPNGLSTEGLLYILGYSTFAYCRASNTGGENFRQLNLGNEQTVISA